MLKIEGVQQSHIPNQAEQVSINKGRKILQISDPKNIQLNGPPDTMSVRAITPVVDKDAQSKFPQMIIRKGSVSRLVNNLSYIGDDIIKNQG